MRTASATDPTRHWAGVIIVAVAAPVTWKVVIGWITSAEAIAMHAETASARCGDQQGALRPMKWPCIYSANADKGKSDDEEEPIHFPSACSCTDESVSRPRVSLQITAHHKMMLPSLT
jgi:hypothetical protein